MVHASIVPAHIHLNTSAASRPFPLHGGVAIICNHCAPRVLDENLSGFYIKYYDPVNAGVRKMMSEKLLMSLLRVIFLWATLCTIASSPQQKCYLSVPLSGPELYYIMREDICSVIVDWSDDIMINADSDRCEEDDISRYEVEVNFMSYCINKSRVFQTVPTGTMYDLSAFLSGINVDSECESATSNCYRHQARIRAQLGNSSWSHYSTWTTVSNTYRTVRGMYILT